MARLLPQAFYVRDALEVARDLLGQEVWRGSVGLRITEVEAYRWTESASHCYRGETPRNKPMWGPGGHAYVYLCYGLHNMLNIVTNPSGEGAAVLVRACEPIGGLSVIRRRRSGKDGPALLTGPGKVGEALGLDTSFSGHALFRKGDLELREGQRPANVLVGSRIGINYAQEVDKNAEWRFAAPDTPWVSHRSGLRPQ